MTKLKFKVGNLSRKDEADFCLVANSGWNDYGIETMYYVHAMPSITRKESRKIGWVKIGTCEQNVKSSRLLHNVMGDDIWEELPYAIVTSCYDVGYRCYASTTVREVYEQEPGKKTVIFQFVNFREY